MTATRVGCDQARILRYDPDGLLLQVSWAALDQPHSAYRIIFSLMYLGRGSVAVDVALVGDRIGHGGDPAAGAGPVELLGMQVGRLPTICMTSADVGEGPVSLRYHVRSSRELAAASGSEIAVTVSGTTPLVTIDTRTSAVNAERLAP